MSIEIISGCGCCGSSCNYMYTGDITGSVIVAYQKISNGTVVVYPDSNHTLPQSYQPHPEWFASFKQALNSWGTVWQIGHPDSACGVASLPTVERALNHLNNGGVLLIIGEYEGCQSSLINPFIQDIGSKLITSKVEPHQKATKNPNDPMLENFPPKLNFLANGVVSC